MASPAGPRPTVRKLSTSGANLPVSFFLLAHNADESLDVFKVRIARHLRSKGAHASLQHSRLELFTSGWEIADSAVLGALPAMDVIQVKTPQRLPPPSADHLPSSSNGEELTGDIDDSSDRRNSRSLNLEAKADDDDDDSESSSSSSSASSCDSSSDSSDSSDSDSSDSSDTSDTSDSSSSADDGPSSSVLLKKRSAATEAGTPNGGPPAKKRALAAPPGGWVAPGNGSEHTKRRNRQRRKSEREQREQLRAGTRGDGDDSGPEEEGILARGLTGGPGHAAKEPASSRHTAGSSQRTRSAGGEAWMLDVAPSDITGPSHITMPSGPAQVAASIRTRTAALLPPGAGSLGFSSTSSSSNGTANGRGKAAASANGKQAAANEEPYRRRDFVPLSARKAEELPSNIKVSRCNATEWYERKYLAQLQADALEEGEEEDTAPARRANDDHWEAPQPAAQGTQEQNEEDEDEMDEDTRMRLAMGLPASFGGSVTAHM